MGQSPKESSRSLPWAANLARYAAWHSSQMWVMLSRITQEANAFGYLSPFKFVDSGVLRPDYGLEGGRLLYFAALSLLLFGLALWKYRKKDILI